MRTKNCWRGGDAGQGWIEGSDPVASTLSERPHGRGGEERRHGGGGGGGAQEDSRLGVGEGEFRFLVREGGDQKPSSGQDRLEMSVGRQLAGREAHLLNV